MQKITQNNFKNIIIQEEISNYHFINIDFSFYILSGKKINDCIFEKCNLSNIKLKDTILNNVVFIKSKLLWLNFLEINKLFSNFSFEDSHLYLSYFMSLNLKNISFWKSMIKECDFTNTILDGSDLSFCNLEKSTFRNTSLKNTDFRWAINLSIDPRINNLSKTKFSSYNALYLLDSFDIIID